MTPNVDLDPSVRQEAQMPEPMARGFALTGILFSPLAMIGEGLAKHRKLGPFACFLLGTSIVLYACGTAEPAPVTPTVSGGTGPRSGEASPAAPAATATAEMVKGNGVLSFIDLQKLATQGTAEENMNVEAKIAQVQGEASTVMPWLTGRAASLKVWNVLARPGEGYLGVTDPTNDTSYVVARENADGMIGSPVVGSVDQAGGMSINYYDQQAKALVPLFSQANAQSGEVEYHTSDGSVVKVKGNLRAEATNYHFAALSTDTDLFTAGIAGGDFSIDKDTGLAIYNVNMERYVEVTAPQSHAWLAVPTPSDGGAPYDAWKDAKGDVVVGRKGTNGAADTVVDVAVEFEDGSIELLPKSVDDLLNQDGTKVVDNADGTRSIVDAQGKVLANEGKDKSWDLVKPVATNVPATQPPADGATATSPDATQGAGEVQIPKELLNQLSRDAAEAALYPYCRKYSIPVPMNAAQAQLAVTQAENDFFATEAGKKIQTQIAGGYLSGHITDYWDPKYQNSGGDPTALDAKGSYEGCMMIWPYKGIDNKTVTSGYIQVADGSWVEVNVPRQTIVP